MLEKLQYKNHMNEVLEFGTKDLFVNENDLRDFAWELTSKNNRISGFKRVIVSKKLPVLIKAKTEAEGYRLRDRLFEVFEKDVLAEKHGEIIIGDYHMKCFVTASGKSEYLKAKSYMKNNLTVKTDMPYWVKETTTRFNYNASQATGTNMDYNRDFPSDYASNLINASLINSNFVSSNFKMMIYGACSNPVVTIAGHNYAVNVSVAENEYLTINSIDQTIILTHSDGSTENCFNLRNRDSYIFEKIPAGVLTIASSANFKFDVVLLEERSEPKWA